MYCPKKPANQVELTLYTFLGEALCKTQIVEQALSVSITIKQNSEAKKTEADEYLDKQLGYTLGKAVYFANRRKHFPPQLQADLNSFLLQRNWLVHRSMLEIKDGLNQDSVRNRLFNTIKDISDAAENLQRDIELNLIEFCQNKGRDMSNVLAAMKEYDENR